MLLANSTSFHDPIPEFPTSMAADAPLPGEIVCECGARPRRPKALYGSAWICPECGRELPWEEESAAPLPLPKASDPEPAVENSPAEPEPDVHSTDSPPIAGGPARRGLWAMMGRGEPPATVTSVPAAESVVESPTAESSVAAPNSPADSPSKQPGPGLGPSRGLWGMMSRPPAPGTQESEETAVEEEAIAQADSQQPDSTTEDDSAAESNSEENAPSKALVSRVLIQPGLPLWSLIGGVAALLLSPLAIWPMYPARIPAAVCGFGALFAAFLIISDNGQQRSALSWQMLLGTTLGVWGMFSTELLWRPLDVYNRWCQAETAESLNRLSVGMQAYATQYEGFPPGMTTRKAAKGELQPLHSWVALLLPYLPEGADISARIKLNEPFDAPANADAMRMTLPCLLAAGGPTDMIRERFAPSHFAGVGGTLELSNHTIAQVGIFDSAQGIRRDELIDGASLTMIVGEIGSEYPGWGDPRNWRTVGRGLNRDVRGFGNAQRTGAMFLMADGSVRFFSNRTEARVLRAYSTRNGEESLPTE